MSLYEQFKARQSAFGIDDAAISDLKEIWPLLEPHIAKLAKEHVAKAATVPMVKKLFEEKGDEIAALTMKSLPRLYRSDFGSTMGEEAKERFEDEVALGLDSRNRPAISSYVVRYLFKSIGRKYRFSGAKAARACASIAQVMLFDIAGAIFFHVTREIEKANQRAREIDGVVEECDHAIADVRKDVTDVVTSLNKTADHLARSAETARGRTQAAAGAAGSASDNVAITAAAAEELSASVSEVYHQVRQSVDLARKAVCDVEHTSTTIQSLSEAVEKIGSVVGVISEIAAQTNLLALNATIEAARAGEAGRGFAVVASEVKALATQTAKATEEISHQIKEIQSTATDAAGAINTVDETIEEMSRIAALVASEVEEQNAVIGNINENVSRAAQGSRSGVDNMGEVNSAADVTGETAETVKSLAGALAGQAEQLRANVDEFLNEVRVA